MSRLLTVMIALALSATSGLATGVEPTNEDLELSGARSLRENPNSMQAIEMRRRMAASEPQADIKRKAMAEAKAKAKARAKSKIKQ